MIELAKKVKKRFLTKCWIKQGGCITWYKCRTYWVYCGMQFKIRGGGINGRPVVCGFGNLDHSGILTYYICIMWQNKSKHLFKTIWTWCLHAFFSFLQGFCLLRIFLQYCVLSPHSVSSVKISFVNKIFCSFRNFVSCVDMK